MKSVLYDLACRKGETVFGAAHFKNEREFAPHASFSDPNMGLPDWTTDVQQAQF